MHTSCIQCSLVSHSIRIKRPEKRRVTKTKWWLLIGIHMTWRYSVSLGGIENKIWAKLVSTLALISVIYLNFYPLEIVSRYRDPQLQVIENYSYVFNLSTNICKSCCLDTLTQWADNFILYVFQLQLCGAWAMTLQVIWNVLTLTLPHHIWDKSLLDTTCPSAGLY